MSEVTSVHTWIRLIEACWILILKSCAQFPFQRSTATLVLFVENTFKVCLTFYLIKHLLIKFVLGRGIGTHAYLHSVSCGHHVFLNLQTLKFYCLPDNYQIIDSSLDDIIYVLKPTFTVTEINELDNNSKPSIAYDGTSYLPGIVGLNNIKQNDYCNVILQALSHVKVIRNFFLLDSNLDAFGQKRSDLLVQRFGELLRKLWNPKNFKAHVSPHEMLQAVVLYSQKKFQITQQGLYKLHFTALI